jgi:hypothetical protein
MVMRARECARLRDPRRLRELPALLPTWGSLCVMSVRVSIFLIAHVALILSAFAIIRAAG